MRGAPRPSRVFQAEDLGGVWLGSAQFAEGRWRGCALRFWSQAGVTRHHPGLGPGVVSEYL